MGKILRRLRSIPDSARSVCGSLVATFAPFSEVRLQVALRHLLHHRFGMLGAPTGRSRKLQGSVRGVSVILHQQPADLHYAIDVTADAEVYGIGRTILREMRTVAGVAEIAALAELRVGKSNAFMPRSRASAGETITEREAAAMRPELCVTTNGREKIRTGQEPSRSRMIERSL
jgi:hypothetical protein